MNSHFDGEAASYDSSFTHSSIGRLQRTQVWNYLDQVLPELTGNEILELNCGTGEDAIYLGKKGYRVLATDISTRMLEVAKSKASIEKGGDNVSFHQLDLTRVDGLNEKKFDLVFSNFGGLNCIDPKAVTKLVDDVSEVLKSNGRLIAVIMSKFCLWEFCYFTLKLDVAKATRRIKKNSTTQLGGDPFPVWYYTPEMIKRMTRSRFKVKQYRPIGFAIPPSYMNSAFEKRGSLLSKLEKVEHKMNHVQWLSNFSDHFLIDLQLK